MGLRIWVKVNKLPLQLAPLDGDCFRTALWALAIVVLFTNRGAFFSPLAVVVMGAVGLAAVLLQLRLQDRNQGQSSRSPAWLNVLEFLCAVGIRRRLVPPQCSAYGGPGFGGRRQFWR